MIHSFTAEYLKKGSQFLHKPEEAIEPSIPYQLGRGLYSLGVIVAAPCGMLYHGVQAIYLRIQAVGQNDQAQQLKERSIQHWHAAYYDLSGLLEITVSVLTAVAIVALPHLALCGEWSSVVAMVSPFVIGYIGGIFPSCLLTVNFARDRGAYLNFISNQTANPTSIPSERMKAEIEMHLFALRKKEKIVNRALTDQEILLLYEKIHAAPPAEESLGLSYDTIFNKHAAFLDMELIKPEHQSLYQTFVNQRRELIDFQKLLKVQKMPEEECALHLFRKFSDARWIAEEVSNSV